MSYPPNPNNSGYPPPYSASQGNAGYNYPPVSGYPPGSGYPPYSQPPAVGFQQPGMVSGPGYPPPPQGYPPPASAGYAPPQGYPQPQGYSYGGGDASGYPPPISSQPTAMGQGAPSAQGYNPNSAIMTPYQPAPDGWMSIPQGIPMNCPPGLEYLTSIDQLLVHQKVELLEALIGFESNNKFTIKNSVGQKVFYAVEDTDCCTRNCCGPWRPFDMKILDNYKNEVIHLNRPLACDSCWFPCCLQSIEVSSPPGCIIGSVQQEWSILTPKFSIKNAAGDTVLTIEGPFCTFSMCGDVEFKVLSKDSSQVVGKISKQWAGLLREAFTDADYFGITFPIDLDVRMKAVMLGACFLIDVMFFEKVGNRETDRPGMF